MQRYRLSGTERVLASFRRVLFGTVLRHHAAPDLPIPDARRVAELRLTESNT